MKTHILLSLIFLFGLLSGCAEHSALQTALDKAEALMEDHPDSAYSLLQTIDSEALRTRGGRALYALLYTQAQDKNYIDETNDSLISVAAEYYRQTDDVRRKFLSYYYMGRVYTNAGDYLNATSYYMEAEQWVDVVADDYLTGLLYSELGRIYRLYYDYPKSFDAYQRSAECYDRSGKIRHRNYMWLNMGDVCRNLNDYDESKRLFSLTLHSAKEINDTTLIRMSLGSMVMQCIEQKEMNKADSLYRELKLYMDDRHASSALYGRLAQMYISAGNFVQAENCIDKGWDRASTRSDSISLYIVSSELYNLTGNVKKAYEEFKNGVLLQNRDIHQSLQQPILTIQRDYLSKELAFLKYRRIVEKTILIIIICVIISITLTVAIKYRKKMQRHNESIRYYVNELTGMKIVMENEKTEKSIQMQELFKEQFKVVGMLGESFIQSADEKNHQKKVYNDVKLLLETYGNDNKFYLQLENIVNRYNDNIIQLLREEIELPESTYHQFCYQIAGFSINVVSLFMKEKPATLYKRRSRVLEKIKVSDTLYKEIFIKYLLK